MQSVSNKFKSDQPNREMDTMECSQFKWITYQRVANRFNNQKKQTSVLQTFVNVTRGKSQRRITNVIAKERAVNLVCVYISNSQK
jgi:hypothetical protein